MTKQEPHGEEGHFNIYERDHDSVVTGKGAHDRVMVCQPDAEGLYCRVDLKWNLGMPSNAQILKVAKAWPNEVKGRWVIDRKEMHDDGKSIDVFFKPYKKVEFKQYYGPGHYWIEVDGKRRGELQRQSFGRSLWTVHIDDKRMIYGSFDIFSLNNAKKVARYHLTGEDITLDN